MVAVEGGKKSAVGGIYNEFPDRLSDTLIIVGAGVAGASWISLTLGLLAALFAIFTAYTRVLGGAIGTDQYFTGPMAKQHRMAFLTVINVICIGAIWIPDINLYAYPARSCYYYSGLCCYYIQTCSSYSKGIKGKSRRIIRENIQFHNFVLK